MLLSVIIVNYNVKYFLEQCLCSVKKALEYRSLLDRGEAEVLVIDNNSVDGSMEYLEPRFPFVRYTVNKENTGFTRANNQGLNMAAGKYVLFLNPDTIVPEDIFKTTISFLEQHADAGAIGVRMIDGSGRFLKESKRGLPTPWASFCKMSGLTAVFPSSKAFAGYYMGHLDEKVTQEVEVLAGAFFMGRRELLQSLGGFDERFFMYAEDIDLSYRLMQAGYKNYYLADAVIIHFKGESTRKDARYVQLFYKAMQQFVDKHYKSSGGKVLSLMLNSAIRLRSGLAKIGKSKNREQQKNNREWNNRENTAQQNNTQRNNGERQMHGDKYKQAVGLPGEVVLHGDPDMISKLEKWLQGNNIRVKTTNNSFAFDGTVSITGADGMVCIFAEGARCSFQEIIKIIRLTPAQKAMIHASGSNSVVGSFDKDGQGIGVAIKQE